MYQQKREMYWPLDRRNWSRVVRDLDRSVLLLRQLGHGVLVESIERARQEVFLRPPEPCTPGCIGYGEYWIDEGLTETQRCDACWHGIEGAPTDEDYQRYVRELASYQTELRRRAALGGQGR